MSRADVALRRTSQQRAIAPVPLSLGAREIENGRWSFRVWAPKAEQVELHLFGDPERILSMQPEDRGYFHVEVEDLSRSAAYKFRLGGQREYPDPASRFQPQGVHSPSQVFATDFAWSDDRWFGLPLAKYVIYELHVGTFTAEGTFDAVIPHLDELRELGVTAIELMPVAQFPGRRNWGYDGAYPFAAQNSYGGPAGLQRLVDACHECGLAVVLDVVYNHLGPEGNYIGEFGEYFTDKYHTPWGRALNFDGPHSDEVRRFFFENAIYWTREFHIDALRLDAVHAIFDNSAYTFLEELADRVRERALESNRRVHIIAESSLNDPRHVLPAQLGGYGLDSQWSDDLHHSIHTLLTDERNGYYADFDGFDDLVTAYRDGFVYAGRYSRYRARRYGRSARSLPGTAFVVSTQTHDQIGNRLLGERLIELSSYEGAKLAAGLVLLSPYIPLLFMGEEYGETAPFQYFISHTEAELVESVRRGRREEFARFLWGHEAPDPQAESTFTQCRLNRALMSADRHQTLWRFYQKLLNLRATRPALACLDRNSMEVERHWQDKVMIVRRWAASEEILVLFHCGTRAARISGFTHDGVWTRLLDSAEAGWLGPGSDLPETFTSSDDELILAPCSLALFARES